MVALVRTGWSGSIYEPRNTRCEDGRLLRTDPSHDDPYGETDIGPCPDCEGKGCDQENEQ